MRDVTRKTVREVLKGLDGAVIESLQGTNLIPNTTAEATKGKPTNPKSEHRKFIMTFSFFLSHLRLARCDIGVQLSVRSFVRPPVHNLHRV